MSEEQLEFLETQVPELSAAALNHAYSTALKSGFGVYVNALMDGGPGTAIYEVFSDGHRNFIKSTEPPTEIPAGTTFQIP